MLLLIISVNCAFASDSYDLEVIAKTGQTDSLGQQKLTFIGNSVSINDDGRVAFMGTLDGVRDGIFEGASPGHFRNITPVFGLQSNRHFDAAVQINNKSKVVATDRVSTNPVLTFVRIWDANSTDAGTEVASAGEASDNYATILSRPSISSNENPNVVFSAIRGSQTLLVMPSFQEVPFDTRNVLLRPMIADNGRVVVRAGSNASDPIRLYLSDLSASSDIATAPNFSSMGRSPGISDDGQIIVFYGSLSDTGAVQLNAIQQDLGYGSGSSRPKIAIPVLSAGEGIFASVRIQDASQSDGTVIDRIIIRMAGAGTVIAGQANHLTTFDNDGRVGVSSVMPSDRAIVVTYAAFDESQPAAKRGLYTNRLYFGTTGDTWQPDKPIAFCLSPATKVVQQGDTVDGLDGTIQDFRLYDPVNNKHGGQLAFWASTDSNVLAVIRARRYAIEEGVDVEEPLDFACMRDNHDVRFVIVDTFKGVTCNREAQAALKKARMNCLKTAAYFELNFKDTAPTPERQVTFALSTVGTEGRFLGFMAVVVEDVPALVSRPIDQAKAVERITKAVQAVEVAGFKAIIYTKKSYWSDITGDTTKFSSYELWHTTETGADDFDIPVLADPAQTFGGWFRRSGKQYDLGGPPDFNGTSFDDCPGDIDKDLFDASAFSDGNPAFQPVLPLLDPGSAIVFSKKLKPALVIDPANGLTDQLFTDNQILLSGPTSTRLQVALSSDDPAVSVPAAVTVDPGASTASFKIIIHAGAPSGRVTISASLNGETRTAILNIVRIARGNRRQEGNSGSGSPPRPR